MNKPVKDSKFLVHDGSWGQLARYAIDKGALSNDDLLCLLVEAGIWGDVNRNPATDLDIAFELAEKHKVFRDGNALTQKKNSWIVGYASYSGTIDALSFGSTVQRAICLYLLRFPEIDRCYNDLPYEGWSMRYD